VPLFISGGLGLVISVLVLRF